MIVSPAAARPLRGFTLVELLVLVVVFSIAVVALLGLGQAAATRIGDAGRAQAAGACAQTVAETLLAARATPGLGITAFPESFDAGCGAFELIHTDAAGNRQAIRPLQALQVPDGMNCALQVMDTGAGACVAEGVACRQAEVVVGTGAVALATAVVVLAGPVEE